ncbi:3-phosphoshikimate 1-carboxyvinyltransferase [Peptacetobacter sp.]|uniref:3-phosphoshikimate 1-carboxyvinyltransferase n=1 Tax=Peptacetobacter sp. TaxID=2991975 RepID=UPI002606403E|nr:3-phosphoshikimate 1-carboxyvinyltransferase [Peptacetobacter sp.]
MNLKIYPKKLSGDIIVPPSKSFAHRALICSSLAEGKNTINNIELSDDIKATLYGLEKIGIKYKLDKNKIEIEGINIKTYNNTEMCNIDCNESGSTLRFLIPIVAALGIKCKFKMSGNLGKRPLDIYYDIFRKNNIYFEKERNSLFINGKLKSGIYEIPGNVSSQFITGMMFALSLLEEDSVIKIINKIESKSYIDITLECLRDFGIKIENNNYREFIIIGKQKYNNIEYTVESDFSQGAFFLCADAIGNDINIKGLNENSVQGDKVGIDILERMNCKKLFDKNKNIKIITDNLKNTKIDASDCPDIIPIFSVCAAFANGNTEIINAKRLRIKECDRLHAISEELSKLGCNIIEKEDSIIINGNGNKKLKGDSTVWSHKDHRICMMLSIASTICEKEIIIKDAECISKSYPRFFEDFKKLGGEYKILGDDIVE